MFWFLLLLTGALCGMLTLALLYVVTRPAPVRQRAVPVLAILAVLTGVELAFSLQGLKAETDGLRRSSMTDCVVQVAAAQGRAQDASREFCACLYQRPALSISAQTAVNICLEQVTAPATEL